MKLYLKDSYCSGYIVWRPLPDSNIFNFLRATHTCGMRISATTKTRHVILDFDIISEIISFEEKGKFGKEKHQNLGVKVKVIA